MGNAVSLINDYATQIAQLQQRQKMAQMLQQQAVDPIAVQSYNGIPAPIPTIALLAKALQGFGGAYLGRQAMKDQAQLNLGQNQKLLDAISDPQAAAPPTDAPPAPPAPSPAAQAPPDPVQNAALVQALQGAGPQSAPPPADIAAPPTGPSGPPVPPPMGGPPAPPVTPPSPPQPALAPPPAPTPFDAQEAAIKARMQKLQAAMADPSLSPASKTILTPMIGQAQTEYNQIERIKGQQLAKQQEVTDDIGRANTLATKLDVPDNVRQTLVDAAQGGTKTLMPFIDVIAKNKLGPHERYATPAEMQASGIPPGSVAQVNDQTGETKILINGHTMKVEDQNVALHRQSVGIAGAHLALDRAQFNQQSLSPPTTVEHMVNGEPVQLAAMFNKKTGGYVDMTGKPVDPTGLRLIPAGASRATLGLLRVSTAAADAATGIENLSKLPAGSNLGWFSHAPNTPLGGLQRALTPQEAQDMQATVGGLSRAMGGLATGGLSVDIPTQQSYDALIPKAGQTRLTAMRQMAEMRQQAENGIEAALANPYITPAQKANLQKAQTKIQNAVPWTPTDVSNLETSNNRNATMRSVGVKATAPVGNSALQSSADAALKKLGLR